MAVGHRRLLAVGHRIRHLTLFGFLAPLRAVRGPHAHAYAAVLRAPCRRLRQISPARRPGRCALRAPEDCPLPPIESPRAPFEGLTTQGFDSSSHESRSTTSNPCRTSRRQPPQRLRLRAMAASGCRATLPCLPTLSSAARRRASVRAVRDHWRGICLRPRVSARIGRGARNTRAPVQTSLKLISVLCLHSGGQR